MSQGLEGVTQILLRQDVTVEHSVHCFIDIKRREVVGEGKEHGDHRGKVCRRRRAEEESVVSIG